MTTNDNDPAQELRNAEGRLACLRTWATNHPDSAFRHPHIKPLEERVRALTAQLAESPEQENNTTMPVNIQVMRDHVATLQNELKTIHRTAGDRPLTRQQQARWDELTADAEEVSSNIEKAEADEARMARVNEQRAKWGSVQVASASYGAEVTPDMAMRMDAGSLRDSALGMLERNADHLTDDQKAHVDKLIRSTSTPDLDAGVLNRHIVLTCGEDYRSAFRKITGPNLSTIVTLSEREASAVAAVNRASMAEGTGSTGGFAVPSFLDPTIALNAQGAANPIRRLARNETITTSQWKGVGTSGVTWAFVGEGQASSDASPSVTQPTVDVHTARAWITYSMELQQDAVNLDGQLLYLLGAGWEDTVAGVLATGSGSGAPKGIITALDAITASEVQIAAPGSLAAGDISKAWVSLPDRARENASWIMHESVREKIADWGDAYGSRTVDMGGRLKSLRERPVYSSEKFPAIATTTGTANQMVVGDLTGYLIVQRAGMTVEPVQTVVSADGLPLGRRGLFAWARIGADVIDAGKLRLLQQ